MFARYIEKNYYKFTLFAAQGATSGSSHQWSDWCGAIPTILSPRVAGDLRHKVSNFRKVATSESVSWQNFGKMLLVFGCIGSDFCKKICVLQHFSKSTRFSS